MNVHFHTHTVWFWLVVQMDINYEFFFSFFTSEMKKIYWINYISMFHVGIYFIDYNLKRIRSILHDYMYTLYRFGYIVWLQSFKMILKNCRNSNCDLFVDWKADSMKHVKQLKWEMKYFYKQIIWFRFIPLYIYVIGNFFCLLLNAKNYIFCYLLYHQFFIYECVDLKILYINYNISFTIILHHSHKH